MPIQQGQLTMIKQDQINIPHGLAAQLGVTPGWCGCSGLGQIDATYRITDGCISAVDAGDLADEDNDTIMVEAPSHWEVVNKTFSGEVVLNSGQKINFLNNKIV